MQPMDGEMAHFQAPQGPGASSAMPGGALSGSASSKRRLGMDDPNCLGGSFSLVVGLDLVKRSLFSRGCEVVSICPAPWPHPGKAHAPARKSAIGPKKEQLSGSQRGTKSKCGASGHPLKAKPASTLPSRVRHLLRASPDCLSKNKCRTQCTSRVTPARTGF